jgi:hypothetical protein
MPGACGKKRKGSRPFSNSAASSAPPDGRKEAFVRSAGPVSNLLVSRLDCMTIRRLTSAKPARQPGFADVAGSFLSAHLLFNLTPHGAVGQLGPACIAAGRVSSDFA